MTQFNYALVALGATVVANGYQTGYPPEHAIDGSEVTFWAPPNNAIGSFRVDLGAPQYITDLRLYCNRGTQATNMWQVTYSFDDVSYNSLGQAFDAQGDEVIQTGGISARYWKFASGGSVGTGNSVYAFEVIGPIEAPPPPTNPADAYIAAWLDGLEANYVPAVQEWLDNN